MRLEVMGFDGPTTSVVQRTALPPAGLDRMRPTTFDRTRG